MEKAKPVFTWRSDNDQKSCSIQTDVLFEKYPKNSGQSPSKYQFSTVSLFVEREKRHNEERHCDQETGGREVRSDKSSFSIRLKSGKNSSLLKEIKSGKLYGNQNLILIT